MAASVVAERMMAQLGSDVSSEDPAAGAGEPTPAPGAVEVCASIERGTPLAIRCAMLAFDTPAITGAMVLIGVQAGMAMREAVIMAISVGIAVGLLIAWSMVIAPSRRMLRDRQQLIGRIVRVARVERDEQLEALLAIEDGHELAPLAHAVHDALTKAHQDRLSAVRLRREMDTRVRDTARKQTAQLSRLSVTDELTGLLNRRGFGVRSAEVFAEAIEARAELSLVAIDLDKFKHLNDTCGHAAGDAALRTLGELVRGHVRDGDVAARLGGDEFVILMPGSTTSAASSAMERLSRIFAAHPAGRGLPWPGMSAGVAARIEHGAGTVDEVKHLADEALYQAKRAGRGQVVIHGSSSRGLSSDRAAA